jgi:hypothetical protein
MSEQHSNRSGGGPRRRRRGPRNSSSSGGPRRSFQGGSSGRGDRRPQTKDNPIVAFFKKILGIGPKKPAPRTNGFDRSNGNGHSNDRDRSNGHDSERSPRAPRRERESAPAAETEGDEESRPARAQTSTVEHQVTTPKLYVGNLSYDAGESDIFDLFAQVGAVKNVEIVRDKNSNSKGFGFVEMETLETALAASQKLHRTQFMERELIVSGARKA